MPACNTRSEFSISLLLKFCTPLKMPDIFGATASFFFIGTWTCTELFRCVYKYLCLVGDFGVPWFLFS